MRRALVAVLLAAGMMFASPTSAGAWFTHCEWDPLVLVVTPAGQIVPVYDSVWTSSLLDIGLPLESYSVSRVYATNGTPETLVDMSIYVPTGLLLRFNLTDEVTSGPLATGTVYAIKSGTSGSPVHLKFVLPTA